MPFTKVQSTSAFIFVYHINRLHLFWVGTILVGSGLRTVYMYSCTPCTCVAVRLCFFCRIVLSSSFFVARLHSTFF